MGGSAGYPWQSEELPLLPMAAVWGSKWSSDARCNTSLGWWGGATAMEEAARVGGAGERRGRRQEKGER